MFPRLNGAAASRRSGGSFRDVQQLAGHAQLGTIQRYIEGSSEAKRRGVIAPMRRWLPPLQVGFWYAA